MKTPRVVIRVSGLPNAWGDSQLLGLSDGLVRAAKQHPMLGVDTADDIDILYPMDRLWRDDPGRVLVDIEVPVSTLASAHSERIVGAMWTVMRGYLPKPFRVQCRVACIEYHNYHFD